MDALVAGADAPKPPKGELLGEAPKAGVEDPKGLGDGVPKGDADDAGLAPKGEEVVAPKPPKLGVEAAVARGGGGGDEGLGPWVCIHCQASMQAKTAMDMAAVPAAATRKAAVRHSLQI